jgi:RIO kinase 1
MIHFTTLIFEIICFYSFLLKALSLIIVFQANVYHATKSDGSELAIKVYKTSVLVFKDRDRYVQGDYRFRYGYCRHNPRKMVKTWAEKEQRNLKR